MLRRARRRRLRTVVVAMVTAGLVAYGGFAGADFVRGLGPHPTPSPAGRSTIPTVTPSSAGSPQVSPSPSGTALREAARFVRTFPVESSTFTANGGPLFAFAINKARTGLTLYRIGTDGSISSRSIPDSLAPYFFSIAVNERSVYLGTRVIQRERQAKDELIRVDPTTLSVAARTTMPQTIIDLLTDGATLWVQLDTEVLRLDPSSLAVLATYSVPGASPFPVGTSAFSSIALGQSGLFATFGNARRTTLYRFDPQSLAVRSTTLVPTSGQGIEVAADSRSAWITGQGFVWKVAPNGRLEGGAKLIEGLEAAVAQGGGLVGLVDQEDGSTILTQIDRSGVVVAQSEIGDAGGGLVVDGYDVWALRGLRLALWLLLHPTR
jgi:hypothetical protein